MDLTDFDPKAADVFLNLWRLGNRDFQPFLRKLVSPSAHIHGFVYGTGEQLRDQIKLH